MRRALDDAEKRFADKDKAYDEVVATKDKAYNDVVAAKDQVIAVQTAALLKSQGLLNSRGIFEN